MINFLIIYSRLVGIPNSANVQATIEKFDEDQDGKLNFAEFLKSVSQSILHIYNQS